MMKLRWVYLALLMAVISPVLAQQNYYSIANGAWGTNGTWSTTGFGGASCACVPNLATDIINIGGGFTVTISAAAGTVASVSIGNNSQLNVGQQLTVTGATSVGGGTNGTLNISSSAGAKIFTGLVTVNAGGSWTGVNSAVTFNGGITNNGGTFTCSNVASSYTFGSSQTLTGNLTIPRMAVTTAGINVTNNGIIAVGTGTTSLTVSGAGTSLTNNGTITVSNAASVVNISTVSAKIYNNGTLTIAGILNGTGTSNFPEIVQGANAVLSLNGTVPTNVTVSSSGTPNTVNYGGAAQTILNNTSGGSYHHLNLSGSGVKTFQAPAYTINITGDLSIAGTVTTSGTGSTLNFNGAAQSISGSGSLVVDNVQLSGSGTKTFSLPITLASNFSLSSGAKAGFNNSYSYSANSITIAGGSQGAGTFGSTTSAATYQTDSYFSGTGLITIATGSFAYYAIATGNWDSKLTWSTLGFGSTENFGLYPTAAESASVGTGVTVSTNGARACSTLTFMSGNTGTSTVDVAGGSLTVSGAITIPRPTSAGGSNILAVASGILTASQIDFTNAAAGTGVHQLTVSTGTATISGNIANANTNISATVSITGTGQVNLGGSLFAANSGTFSAATGSTFNYNGSSGSQTVQPFTYHHLTLSGNASKTSATTTTTVNGNLVIGDGTAVTYANSTLLVNGTTTIGGGTSGSLDFITSTSGSKTFVGLVTVNPGASWNNTIGETFFFAGGINNLGTFNPGTSGTYTFNTSSQTISGVPYIPNLTVSTPGTNVTLTVNGNLAIDVATVTGATNSIANNGTLTINTSLSGTGKITQNASSTLNLSGTVTLSGGITAISTGNTVNYNGGTQTILSGNYYHLTLAGSGTKTLQVGTTSIGGNFAMSGTAAATGASGITFSGDLNIGSTASFTLSSYTYNILGNWTNDGTINGAGSTVSFSGANQSISNAGTTTFYDVQMAGSGTKSLTTEVAITGTLTINNGVLLDLDTISTHTVSTLSLGGTTQPAGTHGSSSANPLPDHVNDVFFAQTTGYLNVGATVFYSRTNNGDWSNPSTWSTVTYNGAAASTIPSSNDVVRLGGGNTVLVTTNTSCKTLSFNQGTFELNVLDISNGVTMTVSGNVVIPRTTSNSGPTTSNMNQIKVNGGTLNAGNISFTNGNTSTSGFNVRHRIDVTTGSILVSGNITATGISGTINYTGSGLLQLMGSIFGTGGATGGTLTMISTSTFEYAGTTQAIRDANYANNLTISGSGTKTWTMGANRTIGGNLSVGSGATLTLVNNRTFGVTGLTDVTGTFNLGGTPQKTFTGDVTLNSGALWNGSSNAPFSFGGNLTNNATTFTPGTGTYVFTGGSKTLAGTTVIPNIQINGLYTNNGTLTASTTLSGTGNLINGATGTLNISGALTLSGLDASTAGNTVVYNGAAAQSISTASTYHNLTINSGASVTLSANITVNGTLYLKSGAFANSSTLTMGNGATINRDAVGSLTGSAPATGTGPYGYSYNLIYSGTGSISTGLEAQGTHVKDVAIGLTGTLTQSSSLNLYGIMLVNAGATYDPGDNQLTVKSWTDTGSDTGGSIGEIKGIFTANRKVTVERYFRSRDDKDSFFASPVTNATVSQLQAAFSVTGPFTGTSFPCTGCLNNGASLRWYKESVAGILNKGYQGYPSSNNLATLKPGVGYDNYMWNGGAPATILYNGPINQGNINGLGTDGSTNQVVSKTVAGAGTPSADGWNLIGNPYPAPIKWTGSNSGGWTLTNIANQAWAWDGNGGGGTGVWVAINAGSDIAVGQPFWVLVNTAGNGTGAIDITEAAKSTARSGAYYRERTEETAMLKVKLSDGDVTESAFISWNREATAQYSLDYDFPKIELGIERMHMTLVKDGKHLGFYGYNESLSNDIPVRIVAETEGQYELSFESLGNFQGLNNYYLFDVVTQERLMFRPDLKYAFQYSKSHPEQRFILTQNEMGSASSVAVSAFPNPTSGKFQIVVNSGEPVLAVELITAAGNLVNSTANAGSLSDRVELNLEDQPNGIYLIKLRLASGVIVKRIIKH